MDKFNEYQEARVQAINQSFANRGIKIDRNFILASSLVLVLLILWIAYRQYRQKILRQQKLKSQLKVLSSAGKNTSGSSSNRTV